MVAGRVCDGLEIDHGAHCVPSGVVRGYAILEGSTAKTKRDPGGRAHRGSAVSEATLEGDDPPDSHCRRPRADSEHTPVHHPCASGPRRTVRGGAWSMRPLADRNYTRTYRKLVRVLERIGLGHTFQVVGTVPACAHDTPAR